MLDADSLRKVTRDVVRALSIVETLSEQVLGMVMVQQGLPASELAPVLGWLATHGILCRTRGERGYVTLGVNGQRLLKTFSTHSGPTINGLGADHGRAEANAG